MIAMARGTIANVFTSINKKERVLHPLCPLRAASPIHHLMNLIGGRLKSVTYLLTRCVVMHATVVTSFPT